MVTMKCKKIFILFPLFFMFFDIVNGQVYITGPKVYKEEKPPFEIPRVRSVFMSFDINRNTFQAQHLQFLRYIYNHKDILVVPYIHTRKNGIFYIDKQGSHIGFNGYVSPAFPASNYITRFGKKFYTCIYDGRVAESSTQFKELKSWQITDDVKVHSAGLIDVVELRNVRILGPYKIYFQSADYEIGTIADAGIILTYYNHGTTSFQLFLIENLDDAFKEQNVLSINSTSFKKPVDITLPIYKNKEGIRWGIHKTDTRIGFNVTFFDVNVLVGDTKQNTAWLALIQSTPDYEYIEIAPFDITEPAHRHCDYTVNGSRRLVERDAKLTMVVKTDDGCNADLENVSISILPEMSISYVEFEFLKGNQILSYKKIGQNIHVKGRIAIGYGTSFTLHFKMPPKKQRVEIYTDVRFVTMRGNKITPVKEINVYEFKEKFNKKPKRTERKDIPEISFVEYLTDAFIACQKVDGSENSGCYFYDFKNQLVKRFVPSLISVLGVDIDSKEIYGYTYTMQIIVFIIDNDAFTLVSNLAYKKIQSSRKFTEGKVFTRKELFEQGKEVVIFKRGEMVYTASYYGIRRQDTGQHIFVWLPGNCAKYVSKKRELALSSCTEIKAYCVNVKSGTFWIKNGSPKHSMSFTAERECEFKELFDIED